MKSGRIKRRIGFADYRAGSGAIDRIIFSIKRKKLPDYVKKTKENISEQVFHQLN
jgi:hypothetical protein